MLLYSDARTTGSPHVCPKMHRERGLRRVEKLSTKSQRLLKVTGGPEGGARRGEKRRKRSLAGVAQWLCIDP